MWLQTILFYLLLGLPCRTASFVVRSPAPFGFSKSRGCQILHFHPPPSAIPCPFLVLSMTDVVDADFYHDEMETKSESTRPKTLVDLSLDSDPEMKDVLVEFVELTPSGNQKSIDCKLPFTIDLEGASYAVGTPSDPMVAVVTDDDSGEIVMLDVDDDSNEELFQIAAAGLVKYMGEDLRLKRTPRVLTVDGDLNSYTNKWIQEENVSTEDFLMTEDENDEFFDEFFRDELGPNYEEEFLLDENDKEAEEAMNLFSVPGLGTEKHDEKGIQEMLREITSGIDLALKYELDGTKALPLFPFKGPDDKTYALVQITQPLLLIGKEDPNIDIAQRLLLNTEESAKILPQVRSEFRDLMERNNL